MTIDELTNLDDEKIIALLNESDEALMEMFKDLLPEVRLIRGSPDTAPRESKPKRSAPPARPPADRSRIKAVLDKLDKLDI